MSTELWVKQPCKHGFVQSHRYNDDGYTYSECNEGSEKRLDPERVVSMWVTAFDGPLQVKATVQDVLEALGQA